MYSLISFPDNYGGQTGLGTTDLQHFNMPVVGKLIFKSRCFLLLLFLILKLGSHDYNPGHKNLPSVKKSIVRNG